jgi:hypothetical protein
LLLLASRQDNTNSSRPSPAARTSSSSDKPFCSITQARFFSWATNNIF